MKMYIHGQNNVTLVGTPQEFADAIGYPEHSDLRDLREATRDLYASSGLSTSFEGRSTWQVSGTWQEFSEAVGYPEASSLVDFSTAFKRLHPSVEVVVLR